jgi:hypothetical protein
MLVRLEDLLLQQLPHKHLPFFSNLIAVYTGLVLNACGRMNVKQDHSNHRELFVPFPTPLVEVFGTANKF